MVTNPWFFDSIQLMENGRIIFFHDILRVILIESPPPRRHFAAPGRRNDRCLELRVVLIEEMLALIVVSAIVNDLRNPQVHIFLPHIFLSAKPKQENVGQENMTGRIYLTRRIGIFATGLRQSRRAGIKFPMP
jgi:hypothetical protein